MATSTKSESKDSKGVPDSGSSSAVDKGAKKDAGNIEQMYGIPPDEEIEQPSVPAPEAFEMGIGEDTEQLSDVSDAYYYGSKSKSSTTSSRFATWLSRISPLIRNKKVRYLTVLNLVLTTLNLLLLLVLIAFLVRFIVFSLRVSMITHGQAIPCLYTYTNWSQCSATCWSGNGEYPTMYRRVNVSSIVQARGGAKPDCPENLARKVDKAPCNAFLCPTNLSSYPMGKMCYRKRADNDSDCYRIRIIPHDGRLILIDANLTEDCSGHSHCEGIF